MTKKHKDICVICKDKLPKGVVNGIATICGMICSKCKKYFQ